MRFEAFSSTSCTPLHRGWYCSRRLQVSWPGALRLRLRLAIPQSYFQSPQRSCTARSRALPFPSSVRSFHGSLFATASLTWIGGVPFCPWFRSPDFEFLCVSLVDFLRYLLAVCSIQSLLTHPSEQSGWSFASSLARWNYSPPHGPSAPGRTCGNRQCSRILCTVHPLAAYCVYEDSPLAAFLFRRVLQCGVRRR